MKTARIAITGASGVGKTTLAEALATKLNLPLVPEVARALCLQMGYQSPVEIPDQQAFRQAVLTRQMVEENGLDGFVADRCTIDCWAMWQRWQICSAMTYTSEDYYLSCRSHAQSYTRIIYVPPLFEPTEDNFRWVEPDYVKQVDRMIRLTLYDWGLLDRTYTIASADQETRADEAARWLYA